MISLDWNPSNHVAYPLVAVSLGVCLLSWIIHSILRGSNTTPLRGPPSKSLLFGLSGYLDRTLDSSAFYEQWAREYGSVYRIPLALGLSRIVLTDPKAVNTYFSRESWIYVRDSTSRRSSERLLGRSLISSEGETHQRQRKALTPAFNNAAIRKLTPIFFDSAYKTKAAWDTLIDSSQSGEALIDVQSWMKHVSLDTIGIAGFSHDFRTLNGEHPDVETAFEAFSDLKPSIFDLAVISISFALPMINRVPTLGRKLARKLGDSLAVTAAELLADLKDVGDQKPEDKSILGQLLKDRDLLVESDSPSEEVVSQMKLLLVAGYETTSISLTWALTELAQRVNVQNKLREEVSEFSTSDPTWDQLTMSLPYLDAVVHESLRLHPPVAINLRVAARDDVLPLSSPVLTSRGTLVDSISIAKGTEIEVPMMAINRSEAFWGPDAKEFKPERWLMENGLDGVKEIRGHRHLLTFADGPRICLGRVFAIAEFKAVLCTLIRNFCFEFPEGATVEVVRGLLPRPKVAGQQGLELPLRVRRVE